MIKQDEQILVVKREHLFQQDQVIHGFVPMSSFEPYMARIDQYKEFLWRSNMEEDPAYKQIIPYMLFAHKGKFFLMRRRHDGNAKELRNKVTLGIGGHLRKEDLITPGSIAQWGKREFEEEVLYAGNCSIRPLGLVNDEGSMIGKVHAGFVFLLEGDSPEIAIKSEFKEGHLLTLEECLAYYDQMELWSQCVIDYIVHASKHQEAGKFYEQSVL